jgi:recombinational DNA repair protein (RecF pathway)
VSYKTYITEALVCGSTNNNTSDKNYLLFSKEAGMLWATAKSVREERSKQRCALQDFSHIRVSLIKGKSGWRIGSVEALGNPFMQADTRVERGTVNFAISELRRYVHGEVSLPRVYDDTFELLRDFRLLHGDRASLIRDIFLVRLLSELGYIAPTSSWAKVVEVSTLHHALQVHTQEMNISIRTAIKEGILASQL